MKVRLYFLPGVKENPALFCSYGYHAVLVHGDAGDLGIQLWHSSALQRKIITNKPTHTHTIQANSSPKYCWTDWLLITSQLPRLGAIIITNYSQIIKNRMIDLVPSKKKLLISRFRLLKHYWVPRSPAPTPSWWGFRAWQTSVGRGARHESSASSHHSPASAAVPCLWRVKRHG